MENGESLAILIGALVTQYFLNSYMSYNLQEAPVFYGNSYQAVWLVSF